MGPERPSERDHGPAGRCGRSGRFRWARFRGGPKPRAARGPRWRDRYDERGGGPLSAWFGFAVFLGLLLFAVQVLFNLYSASVVTSVAYDAARKVAGSRGGQSSAAAAEADARHELGGYASRVSFDWSGSDGDQVVLHVHAHNPSRLLPSLAGPIAFGDIDRTVRVRVERFR